MAEGICPWLLVVSQLAGDFASWREGDGASGETIASRPRSWGHHSVQCPQLSCSLQTRSGRVLHASVAVVHIICVELLIVIGTCGVVTGQRVGGCGWARRAYVCRCGCYSVSCRGHYREDAGADNGSTSQATSNSQNMETEVPEDTRVCV